MIKVTLTQLELEIALFVAWQRNRDGRSANANGGKYGYVGSTLELHFTGCLGEIAFAKATNRYWSGAGCSYHADDDVGNIQVRVTKHRHGCLLVRPNEGALDAPWVLVVGEAPEYTVVGWIWGHETRRDEWLKTPNERPTAYFVPQGALKPIQIEGTEPSPSCTEPAEAGVS